MEELLNQINTLEKSLKFFKKKLKKYTKSQDGFDFDALSDAIDDVKFDATEVLETAMFYSKLHWIRISERADNASKELKTILGEAKYNEMFGESKTLECADNESDSFEHSDFLM